MCCIFVAFSCGVLGQVWYLFKFLIIVFLSTLIEKCDHKLCYFDEDCHYELHMAVRGQVLTNIVQIIYDLPKINTCELR